MRRQSRSLCLLMPKLLVAPLLLGGVEAVPLAARAQVPGSVLRGSGAVESPYDTAMRLGFAAVDRGDSISAASHFHDALFYVPGDREATIAYWNARKALNRKTKPSDQSVHESAYDRFMRLAYQETRNRDYQSALINFRRSLEQRPGDPYAAQAIRNVTSYIAGQKGQSLQPVDTLAISVAEGPYAGETAYDRSMRMGYAAAKERNYYLAVDHFATALADRPGDRLATIAFWNCKHNLNRAASAPRPSTTEENYNHAMRLGYLANQRHHFLEAQRQFQAALVARPGDPYATQALQNVTTYIQAGYVQ